MDIVKCDSCKKIKIEKNKNEWFGIRIASAVLGYKSFDFCQKCGDKIVNKLKGDLKFDNKK